MSRVPFEAVEEEQRLIWRRVSSMKHRYRVFTSTLIKYPSSSQSVCSYMILNMVLTFQNFTNAYRA